MKNTVESVADEALEVTMSFIDNLQKSIKDKPLARMNIIEKQELSGILAKLMRAATGMIKEKRALEKDAREAAEEMSYADQRKFCVEFIKSLPPEERTELKRELGWAKKE